MRRIFATVILAIVLVSVFSLTAFAAADPLDKIVYDRAGVFTPSEIAEIEAKARELYKNSYASVYVVTDDSPYANGYEEEDFISEYDIVGDGIILVITDNANRNYNLYPFGKCYSKISDAEYNEILDDSRVYNNIKSGRYKEGAIACIELAEIACRPNVAGYVIGASVTVIVIVGIFVGCTVYSYKRKMRSEKYPLNRFARLDLNVQRDDFITKFVSVQVIRTNSSSGGGGRSSGGRSGR